MTTRSRSSHPTMVSAGFAFSNQTMHLINLVVGFFRIADAICVLKHRSVDQPWAAGRQCRRVPWRQSQQLGRSSFGSRFLQRVLLILLFGFLQVECECLRLRAGLDASNRALSLTRVRHLIVALFNLIEFVANVFDVAAQWLAHWICCRRWWTWRVCRRCRRIMRSMAPA